MRLLERYLVDERDRCIRNGVRLEAIGRRDRLPVSLVKLLEQTERATAGGRRLHLRLAIDYSSRTAILDAARALQNEPSITADALAQKIGPDVDLLIRTSGEHRLSDFLLWECAYAEMVFTPRMWPEFGEADLGAAVAEFHGRERRFGGLAAQRTA
jgi:undecaprenyl diphosphate synthase